MEIEGYENYLIYEDGKVWSKNVKRYLSACDDGNGYLQVTLCKDGNRKLYNIHRLVALNYIPNPDNKPEVDHWNGKRNDNRVENLRWATYSENGQNRREQNNNKLGIKNICYDKSQDRYRYKKEINGVKYYRWFKTLKEALCYKYIFTLKMRAGLI